MVKPIFQAIKANGVKPAWDTLSAVLWLLRPEDYAPIKISYYRMLAKELDFALPESRPTPKAFAEVLAWMNGFRQAIQGLEPNDWVDVQSFIWGVLPDEEEARTTANSGQDQGRYWVISAGNEKVWPEFRDSGFVAIGWPELGDLTRYDGPTAFETALQKLSGDKKARLNDRLACEEFVRGMQVGDHVFAKLGSKRILGFGKVTSEYRHEGKGDLPNRRDVEWLWSGSVELPRGAWVPLKTLTNVSEYYHFLNHILPIVRKTSSSGDDMSNSDSPTHYWWLNANPRIWDFDAVDIGERQFYTAYNEKGNKRRIFKYFEQAQPGDIVVGYQTSPLRAITAICRITQGLHDRDGVPSIEFEKVESLTTPVPLETFRSQPGMQHCEVVINNQGSLFRLTEDEYDIIRAFIDESEVAISTDSVRPYDKTDAMKDLFLDETLFDTILDLLRFKKNIILQGPPGVGKSFIAKRLAYTLMKEKDDSRVEMVQFHQSYSYEDFIQGYRPGEDGHFVLRNGSFYEFCRRAARQSDKPFVFIIDEINRGNLSKIFGELMLLIEHDKRGADHALPLTYSRSGDDRFHIPDHVHLIGMMNTADRSLAMVDYALRRRFNFVDLEPCFASPRFEAYLKDRGVPERLIQRIVRNMEALNREISKDNTHLGPRYRIGHSFFCPPHKDDFFPDETWYEWVVEYDIAPLLREYWFDNSDLVDGHLERLRG
ncbi:MAG: AAA family ATPase [Ectothiorhodospiraceae bacterium]|nr:AAA family ATPase [Ectothiorhodospiraceae bacterium]